MTIKRTLVVADPPGQTQHTIRRAVGLGVRLGATLDVVGFVYEHIANLPVELDKEQMRRLQERLLAGHQAAVQAALDKAVGKQKIQTSVYVCWEKRLGD